jgi:glutamate 5-kinase
LDRKKYLKKINRVVIKIGSSSITGKKGGPDSSKMEKFCAETAALFKDGVEAIIVTSGAISAGLEYLGIPSRPREISVLQAAAAVGQVELMRKYGDIFAAYGLKIGQILLTREDTARRNQYLNIKSTIENLLALKVIPVINENDSVAVEEIKFGDNDRLGALVSSLTGADLLIILSDIDGLYESDPREDPNAALISFVNGITPHIESLAGGIGSAYSSGGMMSKLKAARICAFSGIPMVIANSSIKDVTKKIVSFETIGTFFAPQTKRKVKSLKRWIAFGIQEKGSIYLDQGAEEAIGSKGKSILPVGVIKTEGSFSRGDTLKVFSHSGKLIAKGLTNFSDDEVAKVMGKNKNQILKEYGRDMCCEVIHRDSMVVFDENDYE